MFKRRPDEINYALRRFHQSFDLCQLRACRFRQKKSLEAQKRAHAPLLESFTSVMFEKGSCQLRAFLYLVEKTVDLNEWRDGCLMIETLEPPMVQRGDTIEITIRDRKRKKRSSRTNGEGRKNIAR